MAVPKIYTGIQVHKTPKLELFKAHTIQRVIKDIKNEINLPRRFAWDNGESPLRVPSSPRHAEEDQAEKKHKISHIEETHRWQPTGQLFTTNTGGHFYMGWRGHHCYDKH